MKIAEDKSIYFKTGLSSNLPTFKDDYMQEQTEEEKNLIRSEDIERNIKNLDPNDVKTLLLFGS